MRQKEGYERQSMKKWNMKSRIWKARYEKQDITKAGHEAFLSYGLLRSKRGCRFKTAASCYVHM